MTSKPLSIGSTTRKPVKRRPPGRPAGNDADALREICLNAALDTFIVRGYEGASIEEIARRAKAGKMTFYRQFGSKAELFRLVAHRAITKVRERLQLPFAADGAPEQVLSEIIARLHTGLTDPEYLAILRLVIAEAERFPELGEAILSEDRYLLQPVTEYLTKAVAAGQLAIPDPNAATMQLAALASGGGRFLIKKPKTDRKSREQWVAALLTLVLGAWQPLSGPGTQPGKQIAE
jgi:TetR/AcrR family transcriptional repressor of mexJK operon